MKILGTTIVMAAALLIPAQAEAQPKNGNRSGVRVEFSYRNAPDWRGRRVCHPVRNRRRVRCSPRSRDFYSYNRGNRGLVRANWGDIHLYAPRARYDYIRLGRRGLEDIMGAGPVSRIRRIGRNAGLRGRMTGTWSETRRAGSLIEVRIDGRRVAELRDYNRDGYVDDVFVRRGRR
ncbi:MAG: hypothetical protein ACR2QM_09645 [Longimicrobiales bacterium]